MVDLSLLPCITHLLHYCKCNFTCALCEPSTHELAHVMAFSARAGLAWVALAVGYRSKEV